ncbi:hypothetical protein CYMTET_56710 [Cymbomonas tetramitiformis]|uniref:Uncharacterized protein n=1 Tax=Cymbomonas tetramitiformis TaxID=36881 RepID=A0AAE0BBN3_9CHLO|nr:hypothetical protein CYMTET_56710 [Cymbomonas tetramitiformis]
MAPTPVAEHVDEEKWVEKLIKQAGKNRKVTIEDLVIALPEPGISGRQPSRIERPSGGSPTKKQDPKALVKESSDVHKPMRPSSPRSLLVCMKHGIDPDDLVYRPLSSYTAEREPAFQKLEYERNEKLRRERLFKLQAERKKILDEQSAIDPKKAKMAAAQKALEEPEDMVAREAKRLAALEKRTKKDMEMMVGTQAKMREHIQMGEEKQKRLKELELEQYKERMQREKEYKEIRAARDMERARKEKEYTEELRKQHLAHFEAQQELAARIEAERVRKLEEQKLEEEKRQAHAAFMRKEHERIMREQQEVLRKRQVEMEQREIIRQKAMEVAKKERIKANQIKRAKTAERVSVAILTGAKREKERKVRIEAKLTEAEKRLQEQAIEREKELNKTKIKNENKQEYRKMKYQESVDIQECRVDIILEKAAHADEIVQASNRRKAWEIEKQRLERNINIKDKQAKVDEMRRAHAYQRHLLRQKIDADTDRARSLLEQRDKLQEKRRVANIDASMQRAMLNECMEHLKVSKKWSRLKELEGKPLDPVTIASVLNPSVHERPTSAPGCSLYTRFQEKRQSMLSRSADIGRMADYLK